MSVETDTPRTDAHIKAQTHTYSPSVNPDFARNLERELNEARQQSDLLLEALKAVEQYLVERGIESRGTTGRTIILPQIRAAIAKAEGGQP